MAGPSRHVPNLTPIKKPSLIGSIKEVQEFLRVYPKSKFSSSNISPEIFITEIYLDEGKVNHTLYTYINKTNINPYNIIYSLHLENTGGFCSPEWGAPAMRNLEESQIMKFLKNEKQCDYDSDCFIFEYICYNFIHIEKYRTTDMCDRGIGCKCINNTCTAINPEKPHASNDTKTIQAANVVAANNQFAFDIYSEFKDKDEESNIFFSPHSISTALAMTYEGARGKTAEEMQSVLHFPVNNSIRRTGFSEIIAQINKEDKEYELRTANALWAQKDYKFLEEYFKIVEQYYGGKVTNLDFVGDAENSRITINNWVENQTKNKIEDLIPQGVLDDMTRLVLTNAVYFKGTWVKQFDKKNTGESDFMVSPKKTVKVQMMSLAGKEARFNYGETEELQILELPYEGNDLSMLVLLPKDDNLKLIEESISAKNLSEWKNNLEVEQVDVYLPKFKFETKYFLSDALKKMGMPTAFSEDADFSGMDGTKNLYISDAIHQAFVEVNEEGTEAAAVTAVGGIRGKEAPHITVFLADHPFIFIIQQREIGNILFLGRVTDPNIVNPQTFDINIVNFSTFDTQIHHI